MRTGGWCGDIPGEVRLAEEELLIAEGTGVTVLQFKGGRFAMGYPLGMPVGVDGGVSFQVYVDGELVEATGRPTAVLSVSAGVQHHVEALGVATHLRQKDQSNVLSHTGGQRVMLEWPGSESADVKTYRIYGNGGSGAVDYETVLSEVDAAPGGVRLTEMRWRSEALPDGTWRFGIRAADGAGNEAEGPVRETGEIEVASVPLPVTRLEAEYESATGTVELTWSGSESFN